jgi:hypothetical protein
VIDDGAAGDVAGEGRAIEDVADDALDAGVDLGPQLVEVARVLAGPDERPDLAPLGAQ